MPTLAEHLLALVTDQPLSAEEKREVALHLLKLVRRVREAQSLVDSAARHRRDT